ncbi:MAG TPA: S1/P1 nuclease [Thermoanaerobaculia bacterium]|nr:S1/P1 nuclease [Thermoanaerobaculia bacterium]
MFARALAIAIGAATLCGATSPAAGWGPTGHRVVGQIATDHLGETARREVQSLLGASLADASTWADEVRDDPRWKWLDPYHYVNLDPSVGRFRGCPPQGCVIDAVESALERLADRSLPDLERAVALRQLVHFVGDLHQPLHVSHAEDRGGGRIEVRWFGEPTNLHWVWDTGIVRESMGRSWRSIATRIEAGLRRGDASPVAGWRSGSVVDWAHESYRLSVEVVYPSVTTDRTLGRSYAATHADLVTEQLAKAGVRLAWLLDRVWSSR